MGKQVEAVELKVEKVGKFLSDMKAAEKQYNKTIGALDSGGKRVSASGEKFASAAKKTDGAGKLIVSTMTAAAGGIGALVSALGGPAGLVVAIGAAITAFIAIKKVVEGVAKVVESFISQIIQFGQEGVMLAGRFEEAELAALAIGRAMGLTEQEIRSGITTINDAGIRYDKAAEAAAKFARNQIDLADAADLVKVAQATGILIGEDSTATMERLTDAIVTGNTARLTALQITVDNQEALKTHADLLDKDVKQLTKQEEVQARVNAILKESTNVMDVYDAAMKSPTKQLRSLTGRELPELKAAFGQAFLPAFSTAIGAIRDFTKMLTSALSEGGMLYPTMIKLGAAASLLADVFAYITQAVINNFPQILSYVDNVLGNFLLMLRPQKFVAEAGKLIFGIDNEFNKGLGQTAEDMFRWGAEIVAALAEGMVSAAHQAMQVMADTISALLSFWFAPGSPPNIAPDIDKWGAGAMTEYLRSFTDADFSVLKTVQSALGNFLSPEKMQDLSKALIGDISAGGGVGENFFSRVANSAGVFGQEVAKLARLEFDLAKATKAMDDANRRYEASQTKVAKTTREYNELLRAGASQQELDAKLAEVRAAEQEKAAAAVEKQQAAQDTGDLERQLELQKQLVDQLAQLFKATGAGAAGATGALGGLSSAIGEAIGAGIDPAGFDISSKIGDAIDAMKETLKTKFKDIFQPLLDAWGNIKTMIFGGVDEFGEPTDGIVQLFGRMVDNIKIFIANLYLSWNTFKTNLALIFLNITDFINNWVLKVGEWFATTVPGYIATLVKKITGEEGLVSAWETVRDIIGGEKDSVYEAITRLGSYVLDQIINNIFPGWIESMTGKKGLVWALEKVREILDKVIEGVTTIARVILEARKEWKRFVDAFDKGTAEAMDPYIAESPSKLEQGIRGATDALPALARGFRGVAAASSGAMFPVTSSRPVGGGASYDYSRSYQGNATVGPNYFNTPIDVAMIESIATRAVRKAIGG